METVRVAPFCARSDEPFQSEVFMDFDPRWSDNPRDRDDYGRELSQGSRGGLSNPRERERRRMAVRQGFGADSDGRSPSLQTGRRAEASTSDA